MKFSLTQIIQFALQKRLDLIRFIGLQRGRWRRLKNIRTYIKEVRSHRSSPAAITDAQIRLLKTTGVLKLPAIIDPELCTTVRSDVLSLTMEGDLKKVRTKPFLYSVRASDMVVHHDKWSEKVTRIEKDVLDIASFYFGLDAIVLKRNFLISKYNRDQQKWQKSQLYHRDYDGLELLKLFIFLDDTQTSQGKFHYIDAEHSRLIQKNTSFFPIHKKDSTVFNIIDRKKAIAVGAKSGDALLIDTHRCFHMGSRMNPEDQTRVVYQLTAVSNYHNQLIQD